MAKERVTNAVVKSLYVYFSYTTLAITKSPIFDKYAFLGRTLGHLATFAPKLCRFHAMEHVLQDVLPQKNHHAKDRLHLRFAGRRLTYVAYSWQHTVKSQLTVIVLYET